MIINPIYSIGLDEMDAQHARWISLIEEFKKIASGHLQESSAIEAARTALTQLLEYTQSHFASEELLIVDQGYPEAEAHKKTHRKLESEVIKLRHDIEAHTAGSVPLRLNLLITIWLLEHITQEDAKYARFILSQRALAGK